MNQGGTADKCFYSSLTECISLSRTFLFYETPLTEIEVQRSLFFVSGGCDMLYTKRWWRTVRRVLKWDHPINNPIYLFGGTDYENSADFY